MKRLIIIRGPAGVGKSTIAGELKKELGALFFSIDYICSRILGQHPKKKKYRYQAYRICYQITKNFGNKNDVIVERLFFDQEDIDQVEKYFKKIDYRTKIITLKAPLKKLVNQDLKRASNNKSLGKDRIKMLNELFISRKIKSKNLEINIKNKKPKTIIKEILEYLAN